jgi:hypothetical protein
MRASKCMTLEWLLSVRRDGLDHGVSSLPQVACDRNQTTGSSDKFVPEQSDISFEQRVMSGEGIIKIYSGGVQKNSAD